MTASASHSIDSCFCLERPATPTAMLSPVSLNPARSLRFLVYSVLEPMPYTWRTAAAPRLAPTESRRPCNCEADVRSTQETSRAGCCRRLQRREISTFQAALESYHGALGAVGPRVNMWRHQAARAQQGQLTLLLLALRDTCERQNRIV